MKRTSLSGMICRFALAGLASRTIRLSVNDGSWETSIGDHRGDWNVTGFFGQVFQDI